MWEKMCLNYKHNYDGCRCKYIIRNKIINMGHIYDNRNVHVKCWMKKWLMHVSLNSFFENFENWCGKHRWLKKICYLLPKHGRWHQLSTFYLNSWQLQYKVWITAVIFLRKKRLPSGWLMHYTQGNKHWAVTQIDREHFIALTNCPTMQKALQNTEGFI